MQSNIQNNLILTFLALRNGMNLEVSSFNFRLYIYSEHFKKQQYTEFEPKFNKRSTNNIQVRSFRF